MGHSKKGIVVNTIIAMVMAAIFILVAASVIGDFFSQFPKTEPIGDATKVVCFGGSNNKLYCVNKESGAVIVPWTNPTSGPQSNQKITQTPALTDKGIYFAAGSYFCGVNIAGAQKFECEKFGRSIATGVVADESKGIACFGDGVDYAERTIHCQDISTGEQKFAVSGDDAGGECSWWSKGLKSAGDDGTAHGRNGKYFGKYLEVRTSATYEDAEKAADDYFGYQCGGGMLHYSSDWFPCILPKSDDMTHSNVHTKATRGCYTASTPVFQSGTDSLYFGLGNYICDVDAVKSLGTKPNINWCAKFDWSLPKGSAEGAGLVCIEGGKDHRVHCMDSTKHANPPDQVIQIKSSGEVMKYALAIAKDNNNNNADLFYGIGTKVCGHHPQIVGNDLKTGDNDLWCKDMERDIPTGFVADANYVCFGDGPGNKIHCLNRMNGVEAFSITSGAWTSRAAQSTPLIQNDVLYAALGDYVCAYKFPFTAAYANKNLDNVGAGAGKYDVDNDPDIVWKNAYRGCVDTGANENIPTDIVGVA